MSAVCTLDVDAKSRSVVAQSIPKERYAAGERGPAIGYWREICQTKPPASGEKGFDLAKYKATAQPKPSTDGVHSQEGPFPSPEAACNASKDPRQEL